MLNAPSRFSILARSAAAADQRFSFAPLKATVPDSADRTGRWENLVQPNTAFRYVPLEISHASGDLDVDLGHARLGRRSCASHECAGRR